MYEKLLEIHGDMFSFLRRSYLLHPVSVQKPAAAQSVRFGKKV